MEIGSMEIIATQEGDSVCLTDQVLRIKTEDAGAGIYYVISIKRWAVDNIEEFITHLRKMVKKTMEEMKNERK